MTFALRPALNPPACASHSTARPERAGSAQPTATSPLHSAQQLCACTNPSLTIYSTIAARREQGRRPVDADFALASDGTVGFAVRGHDPRATLVIDPSLTIGYFTFLGGSGADSATSVVTNVEGGKTMVYVGGTTTSLQGWGGTAQSEGNPSAGSSVFFIAKLDPTQAGAASLVYLAFIGGSLTQLGGKIAVDPQGDVVLAGTTTSYDYPVTDGSVPTKGVSGVQVNDVAISELTTTPSAPNAVTLAFSTLFGGNGNEAQVSPGGVGITAAGAIFVAMDTTSTNLPVYPPVTTNSDGTTSGGPYQATYAGGQTDGEGNGGNTDGFLVEFAKPAQKKSTIKYCTYLGIYGQATVTGLALDSAGNAYLSGYTSDPNGSFATTNGLPGPGQNPQPLPYAGGAYDGFVMKILPSGKGVQDLSYGTFLGGSGSDQAMAIAVSTDSLPGTVYVTGTTNSTDFPLTAATAFQTCLGLPFQSPCRPVSGQTSNAFLAVIAQDTQFHTSLTYSTYLGGSGSEQGNAVFYGSDSQIFVGGTATSVDGPWYENLQPLSGVSDAFLAEINPTAAGRPSLFFASPMGGSVANGASAAAHGNSIAADANGNVYLAGDTNESDFPQLQTPGNGVKSSCVSCTNAPSVSDGFVAVVAVSPQDAPAVTFNTTALRFNPGVDAPQAVAVHNSGSATLTITSVQFSGGADFSVSGTNGCSPSASPVSIAPQSMCSFEVSYTGSGAETGYVVITDNAPVPGSVQSLPLYGGGGGAGVEAVPGALNFGTVSANPPATAQQQVLVTNTGAVPLTNPVLILSGSSAYSIATDTCGSLNAGASCAITVNFTPTSETTYTGQFTLTYAESASQQTVQSVVTYSGTGGAGAPAAAIAPTGLTFAAQSVGTTSSAESVTITNNGTAKLTMGGASLSGSGAAAFSFAGTSGGGCVASGATLAVGASCTFSVSFSPATTGSYSASLSISDNAPTSPQVVQLSGSGIAPSLSISPPSASFGTATMGIASNAVPIVVTNAGTSTVTVSSVTVTGADAADFSAPNNCVPAIAAGKSCTINLSFNPTAGGTRTATLKISDNAPNSPQSIAVSGSAVAAQIGVSPASFGFGGQLANTASAPENFTVTNTAAAPAMLSVTSASITDSTDFQVTNGCSQPIAAGATCTVSVTFDPGASTQSPSRTGTLVIASNSATNAQTSVKLTGSAADFELGPAVSGGTTMTVSAGTTASYSLDLTSLGGFTGSPTITCSSTDALPGPCVTPSNVSATANGQTAFTVTVGTSADAASRRVRAATLATPGSPGTGRMLPSRVPVSLIALLALALATWLSLRAAAPRLRVSSRLRFSLGVSAVILLAGATLVACGGGGGANSDPPPPTGGTYTLTITATSGGTSRTLPLTLIVD